MTGAKRLTGGCQCGAVRYTLMGELIGSAICHCRMCQLASGGPFMAFTGVRPSDILWSGAPKIFASSTIGERGFCGACGTPLTYRLHSRERINVTTASLDDPGASPPQKQNGIEAKLPWTDGLCTLPAQRTSDWLSDDLVRDFKSQQRPNAG